MVEFKITWISLALILILTSEQCFALEMKDEFLNGTFPTDFLWGFATSSYQIEGGYDSDGKGESIWDEYVHRKPSPVRDGSNGDIACDSYHKYKEDVQLLKNSGADYYRFSLSWSRILPDGTPNITNQAGIDYYNNFINELLENNIKPMVTLYHWDLPQPLQAIGGWENETMIEYFTDFARVAYSAFGDRVKQWLTFNEPWVFCVIGYGNNGLAPGVEFPLHAHYQCVHTVLKAHANAYHLYNEEFKPVQNGVCGITLDANWYEPFNNTSPADIQAAERTRQFKHGWLGSPLFFGKYPDVMRDYIDRKSAEDGLDQSRLPILNSYWSNRIRGSLDYLGLNHYTTELIAQARFTNGTPDWWGDQETESYRDPILGESDWLYVVPWGFRKLLNWIKVTYGNPDLYVTENGFSEAYDAGLNDVNRTEFYRSYINEMLKAVVLDGCNVKSYTAWSLLDNFEWTNGYTERFGVHWVNFTDPERRRIPKDSAIFLTKVFADNGFP